MDQDLWNRLGTSQQGIAQLRLFEDLTRKWTQKINLISRATIDQIWARHIEDSARILLLAPESPRIWADFGSGGGFPGIVVAALLADRGAETQVILVESDQRKATFLREAARHLALNVLVKAERAEQISPIGADVVSARALAPLDMLCGFAERHGAPDHICLFPKGETWQEEVANARKNWTFDLEAALDPGHKGSATLKLRSLCRASRDSHV
ncbi:16S rRNA (guanine(527)-N(7))-methyltransferase RsmG [Xinfangfangia sp. D13-10-4-6]|uniref:16S rRNA (guanine(527)-N(7))-methyltransferase RsmG n=1 Tax=Pseudogemmobacter hezensis TaxID=2737662 RepID=UPI0015539D91|nr:16S rRNA (guanine(527)-N(7))-methyltransferase RsmG [Pseudogemmobacter hezensis]NPD17366.1 16S rRNA (guanine(527)-N(7))-methyltransferase RsmG [Pseudogemmobacter hezensis]